MDILDDLWTWVGIPLLMCALLLGISVGILFWVGPPSCDALTAEIGYPHRWSFWGGCQIEVGPGQWIPLSNYFYEEE